MHLHTHEASSVGESNHSRLHTTPCASFSEQPCYGTCELDDGRPDHHQKSGCAEKHTHAGSVSAALVESCLHSRKRDDVNMVGLTVDSVVSAGHTRRADGSKVDHRRTDLDHDPGVEVHERALHARRKEDAGVSEANSMSLRGRRWAVYTQCRERVRHGLTKEGPSHV